MLQGTYVALVTPFKDGSIDWTALEGLIQYHIDNGTTGIVLLGTTAETAGLASDEKDALLRFAINKIGGRLPVMIGTGTNNLHQTLAATVKAKELGADYALIITPYYIKPTQNGMLEYFGIIAKKVDIPIVMYNVPGRTSINMAAATTVQLAREHMNIVGIKEASGNLVQATQIIRDAPEGFLFSGITISLRQYKWLELHVNQILRSTPTLLTTDQFFLQLHQSGCQIRSSMRTLQKQHFCTIIFMELSCN